MGLVWDVRKNIADGREGGSVNKRMRLRRKRVESIFIWYDRRRSVFLGHEWEGRCGIEGQER